MVINSGYGFRCCSFDTLLQNAKDVITKIHQVFYSKMQQFYLKNQQLLQNATTFLQNATFITK